MEYGKSLREQKLEKKYVSLSESYDRLTAAYANLEALYTNLQADFNILVKHKIRLELDRKKQPKLSPDVNTNESELLVE
jgi:hypothetical protein